MLLDPCIPIVDEVDGNLVNRPPMPSLMAQKTPFAKVDEDEKLNPEV
jgi:hypothetical protein